MAFNDLTPQFREIVSRSSLPHVKRQRTSKSARRNREQAEQAAQALVNKEYLREAYNIVGHK